MAKLLTLRRYSILFLLLLFFVLLLTAPLNVVADDEEADTEDNKEELISEQEYTDISAQYHPTSDGLAFIWYLHYATSAEVKAVLDSVYGENEDLVITESAAENAMIIRIKNPTAVKLHRECVDVIRQLDIRPGQVLIDVIIAQINLKNTDNQGFDWQYDSFNSFNQPGLTAKTQIDHANINDSSNFASKKGFKYALVKTDKIKAYIHSLLEQQKIDVLSSPHIMTLSNHEATFSIGTTVPVVTEQEVLKGGSVNYTTEDYEASTKLTVTPRVSMGDDINLSITQTINEIIGYNADNRPLKNEREITTKITLDDLQTVVMGGFIQNSSSEFREKIPVLSEIPLIGHLFNRKEIVNEKNELVVFITPRIINTTLESDEVRDLLKNRLTFKQELEILLENMKRTTPKKADNIEIFVNENDKNWYYTSNDKTGVPILKDSPSKLSSGILFTKEITSQLTPHQAPFGYGPIRMQEYIYNTELKPNNSYAFIHTFTVENPEHYQFVDLRVASDKAAVVYINGEIVDRDPYINTVSGHDFEYWNREIRLQPTILKKGNNEVFAILKNDTTSEDAFFDLKLKGIIKPSIVDQQARTKKKSVANSHLFGLFRRN